MCISYIFVYGKLLSFQKNFSSTGIVSVVLALSNESISVFGKLNMKGKIKMSTMYFTLLRYTHSESSFPGLYHVVEEASVALIILFVPPFLSLVLL